MLELIHNNKDHSDITALLPWYVNGTLPENENTTVAQHVLNCPACQEEIKFLNSTFDAVNDETMASQSNRQFNDLMEHIELTEQQPSSEKTKTRAIELKHWQGRLPLAIAASFVAAMLWFFWATPTGTQSLNTFQTLTSSEQSQVSISITFTNEISAEKATEILTQIDPELKITQTHPMYTVAVPFDYDLIKLSQLLKSLNTNASVSQTNIIDKGK